MVTNRMLKFDQLILRELSLELLRRFPDRFFSLTQLHVSKDLSFAKVWVSAPEDIEQIVKLFTGVSGELRSYLGKKVVARRVPRLYFVADYTEEKAQKIEKLIKNLKKE